MELYYIDLSKYRTPKRADKISPDCSSATHPSHFVLAGASGARLWNAKEAKPSQFWCGFPAGDAGAETGG